MSAHGVMSQLDRDQILLQAGRHPLAAELAHALKERCELPDGAELVVGMSGGPDSTALLVLLAALADRSHGMCAVPRAVHIDHGLRVNSADDASHAVEVCSALGVPCTVVPIELDTNQGNLSERARDARYSALEQAAVALGVDGVCVAHHAEDRLESMLQALCRGSGIGGMVAPWWIRPLGGTRLVRPLLGVSRSALRAFCDTLQVPYVLDPSNECVETARGLLRAEVLPVLEQRWPGAASRASSLADRLHAVAMVWDKELERVFGAAGTVSWQRADLQGHAPELISAGLRRAMTAHDAELEVGVHDRLPAAVLETIACAVLDDKREPRSFALAEGWMVAVDAREVSVFRSQATAEGNRASGPQTPRT